MMEKRVNNCWGIVYILGMLCFLVCILPRIYSFSILPDEFGYWANAAYINGWDWSEILKDNTYYSYGYSILLYPILLFIKNPVIMYRLAVILNFSMIIGILVVSEKIIEEEGIVRKRLISGTVALSPPLLIYAMTTMPEIILCFAFLLTYYFLKQYDKKKQTRWLILAVLMGVFCFFVHMRTIGVLVAFLPLFCRELKEKRALTLFLCLGLMIVLVWMGLQGKNYLLATLYKECLITTDFSAQLSKIQSLFELKYIIFFLVFLIGKVFYIFCASFGMIVVWIKKIIQRESKSMVDVFLMISIIFQIIIITVFNFQQQNLDVYFDGRYLEYFIPIIMIEGFSFLPKEEKKNKNVLTPVWIGLLALCSQLPIVFILQYSQPYMSIMLGTLGKKGIVLFTGISWVLLYFFLYSKKKNIILGIIMCIELFIVTSFTESFVLKGNHFHEDIELISSTLQPYDDIVFLKEDNDEILAPIQFALQDKSVQIVKMQEASSVQAEVLLIPIHSDYYQKHFQKNWEKYDNQLVTKTMIVLY